MMRALKTIMLTGTAFAMLAAAPARSVEAVNGHSLNGHSLNGHSLNGISPNGPSLNGFTDGECAAISAGEIGRVIAVELPR